MFAYQVCFALALSLGASVLEFAQVSRGGAAGGVGQVGGFRSGLGVMRGGAPRGFSGARTGLGAGSSPLFNPPGSLSTHELLNPAGSLSTGQLLNPEPSLFRPRSGGKSAWSSWSARASRQLSILSKEQLRRVVARGAMELGNALDQHDTGEGWKRHLHLDELVRAAEAATGPPDKPASERLTRTRDDFEKVAANGDYQSITQLSGFQAVRFALREYLSPADQRERRKLANSWQELSHDLERFTTAAKWRKYLELPAAAISTATPVAADQAGAARAGLEKALRRYDRVAKDVTYQKVTRLSTFKATRQNLSDYLAQQHSAVTPDN